MIFSQNAKSSLEMANFTLIIKDKHTGKALAGVVLSLLSNQCPLFSLKSSKDGGLKFPSVSAGEYSLELVQAPEGYVLCEKLPLICVTSKGNLRFEKKTFKALSIYFCKK